MFSSDSHRTVLRFFCPALGTDVASPLDEAEVMAVLSMLTVSPRVMPVAASFFRTMSWRAVAKGSKGFAGVAAGLGAAFGAADGAGFLFANEGNPPLTPTLVAALTLGIGFVDATGTLLVVAAVDFEATAETDGGLTLRFFLVSAKDGSAPSGK